MSFLLPAIYSFLAISLLLSLTQRGQVELRFFFLRTLSRAFIMLVTVYVVLITHEAGIYDAFFEIWREP